MLTFEIDDIKEGSNFFMEIFKKQNEFEKKFLDKKTGEILQLFLELHTTIFKDGINYSVEPE
jgi:hypothetical protein